MNDLAVLEKILVEKGRIVDHATLSANFAHLSNINNKISSLIKKGWLIKLKKGLYYISKLGSFGYTSVSNYIIANTIGEKSFISFEAALKFHDLFDQGLRKYRSISKKQYLDKSLEGASYVYIVVKDEDYFGYKTERVDGGNAQIATKERALLDLIEYQKTMYSVSLAIEKIQNHKEELDFDLLTDYLSNYSQIAIKTIGLIFGLLGIDAKPIKLLVKSNKSTHKLFESSDKFSSEWRLYYDSILEEQLS